MNEISQQAQEEIDLLLATDKEVEQFSLEDLYLELEQTKLELERAKLEIAGARMTYAKSEHNFQKRSSSFRDHQRLRYVEERIRAIQSRAAHLQDMNHRLYILIEKLLEEVREKNLELKSGKRPANAVAENQLVQEAQQHRLAPLVSPLQPVMQPPREQLSLKEIDLVLQDVTLTLSREELRLQKVEFIFQNMPLNDLDYQLQLQPLLQQLQNQLQTALNYSFELRETNTYFAMIYACFDQMLREEKKQLEEKNSLEEKLEENISEREEETKKKTLAQRIIEHRLKPFLWPDS